jgi:hypothetical protein
MLYVIGSDTGPLKLGRAKRPKARLHSIATGSSRPIRLLYDAPVAEGLDAEAEALVHENLREHWVCGEWFDVSLDTARAAVDAAIASAQRGDRAFRKSMGRKPLGGTGEKTVMVPMRWAPDDLARIKAALLDGEDRSTFIREAVEAELKRRKA